MCRSPPPTENKTHNEEANLKRQKKKAYLDGCGGRCKIENLETDKERTTMLRLNRKVMCKRVGANFPCFGQGRHQQAQLGFTPSQPVYFVVSKER